LNLKKGQSKSCGCIKKPHKNHGLKDHPLYWIRAGIIERCYNKNSEPYPAYGGRGVIMCDDWLNSPKSFIEWGIANGWRPGLEIDKDIKAKKMGVEPLLYSPERCMFVTRKENCNSRRSSKYLTYNGETKTAAEWSEIYGISQQVFYKRRKRGWNIEKCLTTPLMINKYSFK
jgi:hypothetical protein